MQIGVCSKPFSQENNPFQNQLYMIDLQAAAKTAVIFPPLGKSRTPEVIPWKGGNIMREYELIFIVHPDLEETATNEVVEKVTGWITEAGGKIDKIDPWGKRRLAYEIRKQTEGQYFFVQTQMSPDFISELERNMRYLEPVMRYLVTVVE